MAPFIDNSIELAVTQYALNGHANLLFVANVEGVYCGPCKYMNGISGFCFHFGKLEQAGDTWKRCDRCLDMAARTAMILDYAQRYHASIMAKQASMGKPVETVPPWERVDVLSRTEDNIPTVVVPGGAAKCHDG